MPQAPKSPCSEYGCPATFVKEIGGPSKCPAHQKAKHKRIDANRGTSTERGYGHGWDKVRVQAFVRDHWRCVDCGWEPELVRICRESGLPMPAPATALEILRIRQRRNERHLHGDHVLTIRDRPDLRLDVDNVACRCSVCHARKTMRESVHQ